MRVKLLLVTDIKQTDLADYDQSKAKDFELETNQSPDDNVKRAVDLYNLPEPPTHYALQVADSKEKEYLVDSDDVQGVNENSLLILKVSPVERFNINYSTYLHFFNFFKNYFWKEWKLV